MFWAEIWKISNFFSENYHFLVIKFSVYLKRHVFIMCAPYSCNLFCWVLRTLLLDSHHLWDLETSLCNCWPWWMNVYWCVTSKVFWFWFIRSLKLWCSFRHLPESFFFFFFLLGALHSKFANFCHDYLSCICSKKFYSGHWILKNQTFSLFPIVKMNTNYAEIWRADFQQVPLGHFFL